MKVSVLISPHPFLLLPYIIATSAIGIVKKVEKLTLTRDSFSILW